MGQYQLRKTKVQAVQWHGDHSKIDPFTEIQEGLGIKESVKRMLDGKILVSDEWGSVSARPQQWIVKGLFEHLIAMNDDLFQAIFKAVV